MLPVDLARPGPVPPAPGVFESPWPENRPRARKTVVFILSTSYSGSHYLSLMLGSHSRAMHLGEIHRVQQCQLPLKSLCFACRDRGFCPVFSDIGPANTHRVHDIVLSRINPNTDVLVDNSKRVRGWAERFLDRQEYDRKYIHLIRDPRALVRRWMLKRASWITLARRRWRMLRSFPHRLLAAPFVSTPDALTYQWLELNQRISRFVARNRLDARVVTYRDLARDPVGQLRGLTSWLGLAYEAGQDEYWNFRHHGTQKTEYEWVKEQRTQHIDLRWQEDMPLAMQERIVHNGDVQAYLAQLGLRTDTDGLTRSYAVSGYRF